MKLIELTTLRRSTSTSTSITRSSSETTRNDISATAVDIIVPKRYSSSSSSNKTKFHSLLHSLLTFLPFLFHNRRRNWFPNILSTNVLSITAPSSLRRNLIGTLFGHRYGRVSFSVQFDPRSEPLMLLELDISTTSLLKEMSSGLLRIVLECEKVSGPGSDSGPLRIRVRARKLIKETLWTMYCNGRKCGLATSHTCGGYDRHVLNTIRSVSVGAGVIPVVGDGRKGGVGVEEMGELVYMRAKFERVVGSNDSEALYMMNPDGNGGPELCIFLLRI